MRRTIKLVTLVLFLVQMVIGCGSTGTIKGTVKNESGNTVEGANVTTIPNSYTATTDNEGYYEINDVELGEYTVIATSGSLVGQEDVSIGQGMFACKTADCNIVISTNSYISLSSPLSGTYSDVGYILTTANSPYEITDMVYFYHTNVIIEDDVILQSVTNVEDVTVEFDAETNLIIGNDIVITKKNSSFVDLSLIVYKISEIVDFKNINITGNIYFICQSEEANITNCNFYSIILESTTAIVIVQDSTLSSLDINGNSSNATITNSSLGSICIGNNSSATVSHCNITSFIQITNSSSLNISYSKIRQVSIGIGSWDNSSTATINNCNFLEIIPYGPIIYNFSQYDIDATNNWWTTIDTATIAGEITNISYVTYEPIKTSTITTAGTQ